MQKLTQRNIIYIHISERRDLYMNGTYNENCMKLTHYANIQERNNPKRMKIRGYNCSEASIKRLARIQEALHEYLK